MQAETLHFSSNDIAIATSIAPVGIEKQRAAIETWLDLGFSVVSLNIQSEIDKLQSHFPDIGFYRVERDARQRYGKPFVYVNDVLNFLEGCGASIVGIVNSDIHLRADRNLLSYLHNEAQNAMVFASRIDIDTIECQQGEMYGYGFDMFFFDRCLLKDFPAYDAFCLGIPWWDYWVPLTALQKKFNAKYLQNTVAYHVKHKINYSIKNWREVGIIFAKIFDAELGGKLQKLLDDDRLEELDEELGPSITYEFIQTVYQTTQLLRYELVSPETTEKIDDAFAGETANGLEEIPQLPQESSPLNPSIDRELYYEYLIWSAWHCFQKCEFDCMTQLLKTSLEYTPYSTPESVHDWIEKFVNFSKSHGLQFDAYVFSNVPEWQQLMRSVLIEKKVQSQISV